MAARTGVYLAGLPVLAVAAMLDQATAPLVRLTGRSNNYRLLARRL